MSAYGNGLYGTGTYSEEVLLLPSLTLYPSPTLYPGEAAAASAGTVAVSGGGTVTVTVAVTVTVTVSGGGTGTVTVYGSVPGEGAGLYIVSSERPPLELHAEVTMPNGVTVNWRSSSREPGNRPQGISFSTARMDGFKAGSCSLPRRIDQPQPDLALFNTLRFVGAQGDIAYEGRMAALPRETGNPSTWSVQAAGLMANARDRRFRMIFVDRDMSQWQQAPIERRALLASAGYATGKIQTSADGSGVVWDIPNESIPVNELAEMYYDAGPGVGVGRMDYRGAQTGASWASFEAPKLLMSTTPDFAVVTDAGITLDNNARAIGIDTPKRYALLHVFCQTLVTPATGHQQRFDLINIFGDHGLPAPAATDGFGGVAASDVITWLIENYCPDLNAGGVQTTTYGISHLVFRDRTYPYDAMLACNAYHRWGLECWEGGTVHYGPLDLTDYDWELRLDDFGTQLSPQGPVAEEVANGIEVEYTDAATGRQEVLLPDDYEDLRDDNPLNAVNRAGGYKTTELSIPSPVTIDDAQQIGRMALAEFNAPKHKGTATVRGYVKDRAGNQQPVWKVRAGDRVVITDSVDEEVHVIHETDYSHDDKTLRMSVDDTFSKLDAYLDRYSNANSNRGY